MMTLPLPLRRVLLSLSKVLQLPIQWLSFRLLSVISPQTKIEGVLLIDATGSSMSEESNVVEGALRLIAQADPARFARLRRDLGRILLASQGGPEYLHIARACILNASEVRRQSPERVAMTLVHEATHARLSRAGFANAWALRHRIERLCVNEEIAFAQLVPGTESLIKEAQRALDVPWYTEHQLFERKIAQLRSLGRPEWMLRLYRFVLEPAPDATRH